MITRGTITIYHISLNATTKLEEYTRYVYTNCWYFIKENSSISSGIDESNEIDIRIPYETNENADISHFSKGDIIYIGTGAENITSQTELGNDIYRITMLNNNNFGNNQHIHLGGK